MKNKCEAIVRRTFFPNENKINQSSVSRSVRGYKKI